jgi:sulfur carrier protein
MNIRVNGIGQSLSGNISIFELIREKGLNPEKIVVEHNYDIIPKEKWAGTLLKEEDNIEIVSFVGGG